MTNQNCPSPRGIVSSLKIYSLRGELVSKRNRPRALKVSPVVLSPLSKKYIRGETLYRNEIAPAKWAPSGIASSF